MSSSNCCFLTCIQVSQEAGQVVCYSHLLQNCPQFIVIQTVKGFDTVKKAEIDVFLKFSCFFYDLADAGNLISGSSIFSKTSWTSGSSRFMYCWSLAWRTPHTIHKKWLKNVHWGSSLVMQRPRLLTPNAGGPGSRPVRGLDPACCNCLLAKTKKSHMEQLRPGTDKYIFFKKCSLT